LLDVSLRSDASYLRESWSPTNPVRFMSKKRQAIKTKIHEFWNYIKVAFNIKTLMRNSVVTPK
ncbi:hypothetical protein, partial [Acinetobacter nosocomialis]|uniref:hypothetical protein n=1 Tax=Acinetobacter nosocomialis TaxID=106654 RepID=UPI001BB469A0